MEEDNNKDNIKIHFGDYPKDKIIEMAREMFIKYFSARFAHTEVNGRLYSTTECSYTPPHELAGWYLHAATEFYAAIDEWEEEHKESLEKDIRENIRWKEIDEKIDRQMLREDILEELKKENSED